MEGPHDKMPSQELQEWLEKGGVPPAVEVFCKKLALESVMDEGGVSTATLAIMERILAADSEEDIFAAANAGTTSGKDFVGRPFQLLDENIEWKASAAQFREQGGFPFYAICRAVDIQTGAELVLGCGGFSFMATLWTLHDRGIITRYDKDGGMGLILKEKPAANGSVLLLEKFTIPAPAKNGAKN